MKNLRLLLELCSEVELQTEGETLLHSTFDVQQRRIFFATSANFIYAVCLPSSHEEKASADHSLRTLKCEPLKLEPGDWITALDYQIEKEALIVGTSSGDLLLHSVDYSTFEIVGSVDGGIKCLASSPDGALLAVTTGFGQLIVMTCDWEVLYEAEIDHQFIGEMQESYISWRGDGKFFATISKFQSTPSLGKLKIWERDLGTVHAATECKPFMGLCLDWMPSGPKVACVYDRKDENKCPSIVFYEKNGLVRSSFSVNEEAESHVKALRWNCSSDLLAASVSCMKYDAIKIWYFSNNHWYLKQEMRYPTKDGIRFSWDPTKSCQLVSWTVDGKVNVYAFEWSTAVNDSSVSLVIDDSNILVTPFALALLPPPMSFLKLKFSNSIFEISSLPCHSVMQVAALLCDGSLSIMELPSTDEWEQFESKTLTSEVSLSNLRLKKLCHLTWLDSHTLLGVSLSKLKTYNYYLQEIELSRSEGLKEWLIKDIKMLEVEGPVISISKNPARNGSAFVQLDGGSLYEYNSNMNFNGFSRAPIMRKLNSYDCFQSSCPWMKSFLAFDNGIMKSMILGLDDVGRLYLGKKVICPNCVSFSFYSDSERMKHQVATHLILTTRQDSMFILGLDQILPDIPETLTISTNSGAHRKVKEENLECIPVWERGAKIVGVLHGNEAAVILQTSRGNLECVYPRKLVLVEIINCLVHRRFRDAMSMVRRHRIDFNFLVDYLGWQNFVKSAEEFVSQVQNLTYITDFVCAIKEESVTETVYKAAKSLSSAYTEILLGDPETKVSSVLSAIREGLEKSMPGSPERELCILTTLAKTRPPALEEALSRIKRMREMELLSQDVASKEAHCPSAEEAVKHLLWLSESEAVYEAALGSYDLNLAAIVALNSEKDPKEFLPYLESLQKLPITIMKHTIDMKLGKYESALRHIIEAGEDHYDEAMGLMKSNPELFPLGLDLVNGPIKRKQVLEAWGDHLQQVKSFDLAAAAYLCCFCYEKALKAYRACGDWKGVLTVAGLLKYSQSNVAQLAAELCEELQAVGKAAAAAQIALEYCADVAGCIGYLVAAREWEEALRIGYLHEREDLIADVATAAAECCNSLTGEYKEGSEKVGKYVARYLAVRQRRLLLAAKLRAEDKAADDFDDDALSETSSAFSGMSAYTSSSTNQASGASVSPSTASKQRKSRKPKVNGKIRAGSPGEELALVEHLKTMALTSVAQREVKSLVLSLVTLGKADSARQLQSAVDYFVHSHLAALQLCEDTSSTEIVDQVAHTLDRYRERIGWTPSISSSILAPLRENLI